MRPFWERKHGTLWSANLVLLTAAVFLLSFGMGILGGTRTNFFINTLGLSGEQVLWFEGIREIPGLTLMFIAAVVMHLPLSWQTAAYVLIMGIGYGLYASVNSYEGLIAVALIASLGMHGWMPLNSALGMSLAGKEKSGQVLGILSSVGALAAIAGTGGIALASRVLADMSLRVYYVVGGAVIILGGLLIAKLPEEIGATDIAKPRLLLRRRYWLYYVLTFLQGSRKQILGTFTMLVLVARYGLEVWQISLLLLVSGIINFATAPVLGRLLDRYGERATLTVSYLLLATSCVGYATLKPVWALAGLVVLIRLLLVLGMGLSTYVNRIAPAEELAPTLSAGISINHVTSVGMPLLAGVLLPIVHYEGLFWGAALIVLLSVPFTLAIRAGAGSLATRSPSPQ